MEIQVATLCDSAVDYGGKLSLLGAFDTIVARELPAVHPQCSVALRILFRKEEEGSHTLSVNVGSMGDFFFSTHNLVLNLQQLRFENSGLYSVDVAIDGRQIASVPLQILQRQQRTQ